MRKTKDLKVTSPLEKFSYSMGEYGSGLVSGFISSFLLLYYTDSALISSAFVGTMMLVCRLFDAFSDLLMSVVIEKTHTKWGKARPWVLISAIPFALCTILMFRVPQNLGVTGKNAYVFITYFLMTVIVQTIFLMGYHSMLPRISLESNDRNKITSVRVVFQSLATITVSFITTGIINALGGTSSPDAWSTMATIYAAIAFVLILVTFFGCKEKISAAPVAEEVPGKKESLWDGMKAVLKVKYFYISALVAVIGSISGNLMMQAGIYYAKDVLGDEGLFGLLAMAVLFPTIIGVALSPAVFKKFSKRSVIVTCSIIMIGIAAMQFIDTRSLPLVLLVLALRHIFNGPINVAQWTFASDIVEYVEKQTGKRYEGFATVANSFGQKVGLGLGSAMVGWTLAIGGYDGTLAVQPESAVNAIIALTVIGPLVMCALIGIAMSFWDLEKKNKQ